MFRLFTVVHSTCSPCSKTGCFWVFRFAAQEISLASTSKFKIWLEVFPESHFSRVFEPYKGLSISLHIFVSSNGFYIITYLANKSQKGDKRDVVCTDTPSRCGGRLFSAKSTAQKAAASAVFALYCFSAVPAYPWQEMKLLKVLNMHLWLFSATKTGKIVVPNKAKWCRYSFLTPVEAVRSDLTSTW